MGRIPSTRFVDLGSDLSPDFYLDISGKTAKSGGGKLFDAVRPFISSISYEMDEELADLLEITIVNQPDDGLGGAPSKFDWYALLDSKAFAEGNYIDVWMGYGGIFKFMGRTEIVEWLPEFAPDGQPFTIKALDGRHLMMNSNRIKSGKKWAGEKRKKPRKTSYTNLSDDEIVKKIAQKYGYSSDTDKPEKKRHKIKGRSPARIQPASMNDWAFLQKLADINRFDLWVDYSETKKQFVVHFRERADFGSGTYIFSYSQNDGGLLEARPRFAVGEQSTDVEVLFFDRRKAAVQRTIISDTNPAESLKLPGGSPGDFHAKKEITKGARVRFSAFGQTFEVIADKPFRSKNDAETFAKNWLLERERDLLIVEGKVVGIETLRPRQVHELDGIGTRCDGLYRFTKVKHVQAPGMIYHCEFNAHKILSQDVARRKATTKVVTVAKKTTA